MDYIDESEVLTMADEDNHIDKHDFNVPFVCGCRDLGEALRRIAEGAAMLRTKGEAGTGNIVEAVRHARTVQGQIKRVAAMSKEELYTYARVRSHASVYCSNCQFDLCSCSCQYICCSSKTCLIHLLFQIKYLPYDRTSAPPTSW